MPQLLMAYGRRAYATTYRRPYRRQGGLRWGGLRTRVARYAGSPRSYTGYARKKTRSAYGRVGFRWYKYK